MVCSFLKSLFHTNSSSTQLAAETATSSSEPEAENNDGRDERRDERDEHVAHDTLRRCALFMIVGRDAYDKTVVHFPASFRVFMRLS